MDIAALRRSWQQLAAAGAEPARYFYARLFVAAPEVRSMFPTNMQHQEDKLLAALGHILTHVDDADELAAFARRLGADHRRFQGRDARGHFGLSERHYAWVGQALLATLEHFLGPSWTPSLRQDWAAAYQVVTRLMLDGAAEADQVSPPFWRAEVLHVDRRTVDVCIFTIRPEWLCPYLPGQSLPVHVPQLGTWRYLSPANAPREDGTIELHVRATGRFSTHLVRRLQVGDELHLGNPVGTTLASYGRAPHRPLLLIAGGTGLAPLKAIVEALCDQPARQTTLIVGGGTPDDLYDDAALSRIAATARWLRYLPTVESGWGWIGETGRAVDVAKRQTSLDQADILICGSPDMTRDTIATLVAGGVRPDRVLTEAYDHSLYPPLTTAAAASPREHVRAGTQ